MKPGNVVVGDNGQIIGVAASGPRNAEFPVLNEDTGKPTGETRTECVVDVVLSGTVSMREPSALEGLWRRWRRDTFGGGLIPFDSAYWEARNAGKSIAEAQAAGVDALMDAFLAFVRQQA